MSENTIEVYKQNEVFLNLKTDYSIRQELNDYFAFRVPNYQFMPAYKHGLWDGYMRLFDAIRTSNLYYGLLPLLEKFASDRKYTLDYQYDESFENGDYSKIELEQFIGELKLPHKVRDYQFEGCLTAIRENRGILELATGSGKSLCIYILSKFYEHKKLIIVPTINLVSQMKNDFIEYGCDPEDIHTITAGASKETDKPIVISTWQSIYKMSIKWFNQFGVIFGDECHLFQAKSLSRMLEKCNARYRFGFTGTLDDSQVHRLVLQGLFGRVLISVRPAELIEKGDLSNLQIKCLVLQYNNNIRKSVSSLNYNDEKYFLFECKERNEFIAKLASSTNGNALILISHVQRHGNQLIDDVKKYAEKTGKKVYYIHGSVAKDDRERIRQIVSKENNSIILATYHTYSTGINIPNLANVIFAGPSKSKIRILQSIGRGLRLHETKEKLILFDIADDLTWKSKTNTTFEHFKERLRKYVKEEFTYKTKRIQLK